MNGVVLPGGTLGVLGSGQLGRMFAIAARRMGYRVHVLSPDDDTPAGQVADEEIKAEYEDLDAVAAFARRVDVVTFEFENVPAAATETAARFVPVRPGGLVLHTTQNRIREKSFLRDHGLPVTSFLPVQSLQQLRDGLSQLGTPAVLKTADWGYDGKGQRMIRSAPDAEAIWPQFEGRSSILERFVDFELEASVVAARGADGTFAHYGLIANTHANHILDLSVCPSGLDPKFERDAVEIARTILEKLDVIGVLCVEFFVTRDGRLLVNELAPRPHNSGHLTIDAHLTCQFEQQVRAAAGLPLGSTERLRPAAMANLLGDVWKTGEPNWPAACAAAEAKLHLYGKREARPGRKMGHITALAATSEDAAAAALRARDALTSAG